MGAAFLIKRHGPGPLLDVTLSGLLEDADAERLVAAVNAEVAAFDCAAGSHRALYDISDCKIQPQGTIRRLRQHSDRGGRVASRLAIIVGSSLMRMQVRRIIGAERNMRIFDDRAAALAWLREGLPVAPPARDGRAEPKRAYQAS